MKPENALRGYALPILFFQVTGKTWGTQLKWVREVVTARRLTTLPNASDFTAGVINIRGDVISVLDTASLLKDNRSKHGWNRIILLDTTGPPVGLAVDGVTAVKTVMPETFTKPIPADSETTSRQYVSGVTTWNGNRIPLLDIPIMVTHLQNDIPYIKEARA